MTTKKRLYVPVEADSDLRTKFLDTRNKEGLSAKALAELVGCHHGLIHRYENGMLWVSVEQKDYLLKMHELLNVEPPKFGPPTYNNGAGHRKAVKMQEPEPTHQKVDPLKRISGTPVTPPKQPSPLDKLKQLNAAADEQAREKQFRDDAKFKSDVMRIYIPPTGSELGPKWFTEANVVYMLYKKGTLNAQTAKDAIFAIFQRNNP